LAFVKQEGGKGWRYVVDDSGVHFLVNKLALQHLFIDEVGSVDRLPQALRYEAVGEVVVAIMNIRKKLMKKIFKKDMVRQEMEMEGKKVETDAEFSVNIVHDFGDLLFSRVGVSGTMKIPKEVFN
jgi:hypothetical protein